MSRVPKEVLETQYKVRLPPRDSNQYTASVFLQLIAGSHGWLSGAGVPNEAVAARHVLKDYTNGKLLYCQLRPDYDPIKHGEVSQSGFNLEIKSTEEVADARAYQPLDSVSEEEDVEEEKSTVTASSV
jgi:ribosome biogenesis GTPase A